MKDLCFSAKVPSSAYDTVLLHVASHGYVVIAPEKVEDVMLALNATWLDDVDHWAQSHLKSRLVNAGNAIVVSDFRGYEYRKHNSPNKLSLQVLSNKNIY